MMKWGKKKPSSSPSSSSSSSSHTQLISHVFPLSWFSKSKQPTKKPTSIIPKATHKPKQKSPKMTPKSPISDKKFYTQDNDGFWRLSFGNNHQEPIHNHINLTDSHQYCGNCKSNVYLRNEIAKDEGLERTYRRIIKATSKLRGELGEEVTKEEKIREFHSKSEKQRKSFHISKEYSSQQLRQGKIKVQSPRIKAVENLKTKKKKNLQMKESYAVVKSSRDPQQDFRESMLEMIMDKRITKPEELEDLLACYLTLNADEYHELIIKVFRQVWFDLDMNPYFDQKLAEERRLN